MFKRGDHEPQVNNSARKDTQLLNWSIWEKRPGRQSFYKKMKAPHDPYQDTVTVLAFGNVL